MAILSASRIGKSFGALEVLHDISLELRAGEIVCLLGASGCGKTTLLQILAGLEKPDKGAVGSDLPRPGKKIGYMTQNDPLLPWLSCLQNVALGPEMLDIDKAAAQKKAAHLLKQAGLEGFENAHPDEMSGGMQQRALLARTLATDPQLLLLDEPMSKLDVLARRQMADILRAYVRDNRAAALVVTHSVEEACFLGDRILLITRSPAVIHAEIEAGHESMDRVMEALMQTLQEAAA